MRIKLFFTILTLNLFTTLSIFGQSQNEIHYFGKIQPKNSENMQILVTNDEFYNDQNIMINIIQDGKNVGIINTQKEYTITLSFNKNEHDVKLFTINSNTKSEITDHTQSGNSYKWVIKPQENQLQDTLIYKFEIQPKGYLNLYEIFIPIATTNIISKTLINIPNIHLNNIFINDDKTDNAYGVDDGFKVDGKISPGESAKLIIELTLNDSITKEFISESVKTNIDISAFNLNLNSIDISTDDNLNKFGFKKAKITYEMTAPIIFPNRTMINVAINKINYKLFIDKNGNLKYDSKIIDFFAPILEEKEITKFSKDFPGSLVINSKLMSSSSVQEEIKNKIKTNIIPNKIYYDNNTKSLIFETKIDRVTTKYQNEINYKESYITYTVDDEYFNEKVTNDSTKNKMSAILLKLGNTQITKIKEIHIAQNLKYLLETPLFAGISISYLPVSQLYKLKNINKNRISDDVFLGFFVSKYSENFNFQFAASINLPMLSRPNTDNSLGINNVSDLANSSNTIIEIPIENPIVSPGFKLDGSALYRITPNISAGPIFSMSQVKTLIPVIASSPFKNEEFYTEYIVNNIISLGANISYKINKSSISICYLTNSKLSTLSLNYGIQL